MHPIGQRKLLGRREAARLFGVSKQTIHGWIKAGKLPQPRRSFFSTRWEYEKLVLLVKFKPDKTRTASEDSDQSEPTANTGRALNTNFDFRNRTEAEERETNSPPDLRGNRA
jgi:predicted DNA-binding transcriptional regulator AlpA